MPTTIGSRAAVWHKHALKTSGGLTRGDLMMNKHGRIVSKKKHNTAKKEMRLVKYGFATKKGKFGFVKTKSNKRSSRRSKSKSRKMRGGSPALVGDKYTLGGDNMGGSVVPNEAFTKMTPSNV